MSDPTDSPPAPDVDEAPGWFVTDPDGNIVASGPISQAQAAFLTGETSDSEEQQ